MQSLRKTALASVVAAIALGLAPVAAQAAQDWQCVPVARMLSGIEIFGDANSWWRQASGKYETGSRPRAGSVLVFKASGSMTKGHVAAVSSVLTERIVKVTHANWSQIDGRRGQIEEDVTVVDVSEAGDWSQVKVWYDPIGDLGSTVYPTHGFIHQDEAAIRAATGVEGVELAATLVTRAALNSANAMDAAGDRIAALVQRQSATRPERGGDQSLIPF
jgi:surface antigen